MRLRYFVVFGMLFLALVLLFALNPGDMFGFSAPTEETQTKEIVSPSEVVENTAAVPIFTPIPITMDQLVTLMPTLGPVPTLVPTQVAFFEPVDACNDVLYSQSFNMNIMYPLTAKINMTAESFYGGVSDLENTEIIFEGGCVVVSDPAKEEPWIVFVGIKLRERWIAECPYFDDVVIGSKNFAGEFNSSSIERFFSYFHSGMVYMASSYGCSLEPVYREAAYMWDGVVLATITKAKIVGEVWGATNEDNMWLVGTFEIDR